MYLASIMRIGELSKLSGVAVETIRAFLKGHDMVVYLVLFDAFAYEIAKKRYGFTADAEEPHTAL